MTTNDLYASHIQSENICQPAKEKSGPAQNPHQCHKSTRVLRHHAIALAMGMVPVVATGQPQGGRVVSGSATITQSGSPGQTVTTVQQSSAIASLQWQSFNL